MPTQTASESHPQLYGFPLILYSLMLRVAATLFGQFFLHLIDRVLWTVENLTYWSIPEHRLADFENAPQTPLVRPLSWWLFLPGLLWLRLIRKGLSVVLWFIGTEPVTPISMVCYVQMQRKHIQSIKQAGAQKIRKSREESGRKGGFIQRILINLQKIFYITFLRHDDDEVKVMHPQTPDSNEEESADEEETELTFAELLEKYTNIEYSEENDPDYVPDEESSTETSSEGEDEDANVLLEKDEGERNFKNTFICEPSTSPSGGSYPRSKTPPIRDYSNSLHPSGSIQFPISSHQYSNNECENLLMGQETKVQNGTSMDRQKAQTSKRNNQKSRPNANRWNLKKNNVRKPPVITVSGTNNIGGNFFNANDAPKHTTPSGNSSPNKTTQSNELKKKDADQHQEIF